MPPTGSNRFCVSALLAHPTMLLNLAGHSRDAVLDELASGIPELRDAPGKLAQLLKALREREALHSTGVGDGVAFPHARTALAGVVDHPVIVFGRHPRGIDYGAIDGRPVQLFFLLVTTSVTQHLQILARISRLLRDATLRQELLAAQHPDQVLGSIRDVEQKM